jgi:hypothetical protein
MGSQPPHAPAVPAVPHVDPHLPLRDSPAFRDYFVSIPFRAWTAAGWCCCELSDFGHIPFRHGPQVAVGIAEAEPAERKEQYIEANYVESIGHVN